MKDKTDMMVETLINKFNVLFNDIAELNKEDYELMEKIAIELFELHRPE